VISDSLEMKFQDKLAVPDPGRLRQAQTAYIIQTQVMAFASLIGNRAGFPLHCRV
jgi:hypothetical protein